MGNCVHGDSCQWFLGMRPRGKRKKRSLVMLLEFFWTNRDSQFKFHVGILQLEILNSSTVILFNVFFLVFFFGVAKCQIYMESVGWGVALEATLVALGAHISVHRWMCKFVNWESSKQESKREWLAVLTINENQEFHSVYSSVTLKHARNSLHAITEDSSRLIFRVGWRQVPYWWQVGGFSYKILTPDGWFYEEHVFDPDNPMKLKWELKMNIGACILGANRNESYDDSIYNIAKDSCSRIFCLIWPEMTTIDEVSSSFLAGCRDTIEEARRLMRLNFVWSDMTEFGNMCILFCSKNHHSDASWTYLSFGNRRSLFFGMYCVGVRCDVWGCTVFFWKLRAISMACMIQRWLAVQLREKIKGRLNKRMKDAENL